MKLGLTTLILTAGLATGTVARADVRLHPLFGDNMVLQRDREVPVWGWAEPGQKITVTFAGQTKSATSATDGRWEVRLDPMPASAEPRTMTIASTPHSALRIPHLKGVLVGDVWLASGQSNMWWPVRRAKAAGKEIAAADHPNIRLFQVPLAAGGQPRTEVQGNWAVCSPESVSDFSAVAYFFGRHLHQTLDVPIGLIHSSVRGTAIEMWIPPKVIDRLRDVTPIPDLWDARRETWALDRFPAPQKKAYEYSQSVMQAMAEYMERWEALRAAGHEDPREQMDPDYLASFKQAQKMLIEFKKSLPSGLYNAMIHPLAPYALRGAIWYQGESNALNWNAGSPHYRALLGRMIAGWRATWGQGDFPFLIVGLGRYKPHPETPGDSGMARVREAQFQVQNDVPRVGFASLIDLGEARNVHFRNKQEVGRRLGLVAQATAYDRDVVYSGPTFKEATRTEDGFLVRFDHVHGGLTTPEDVPLKGFSVAGADKTWHWAKATITNGAVRVSSAAVREPAAVRYAWADNPDANLYNAAGLPAVAFRTDDWPRRE